ncbi:hypothetical protein KAX75_01335, partial [candidate division WOR-3 bacterium]|nr:hypothetical protein [candidate division WOR-3 bacterium]
MNKLFKYILVLLFISFVFNLDLPIPQESTFPVSPTLRYSISQALSSRISSSLLYAYPDGWSDDILLTPETPGYRLDPDVGVDSYNNVWVVWDSVFWGNGYVYYSKLDSLGNCLIPETQLPDPMHSCDGQAKVVVDNNGNVHIQWAEPSPTGTGIGYAKLDNSGSLIVQPKLAMPGYGGDGTFNQHEIALDKYKNVNIVWVEIFSGTDQISYTKLDSVGDTLIPRISISPIGLLACWPGIGVDSMANNHMAYRIDSIFQDRLAYSKLDKDGNILISNKIFGTGLLPTIIADYSQNIHIVYEDPAGPGMSIEYLKLDQNANILVGPKTLSIHEDNFHPHMAMDSLQYLHVAWEADSVGTFPIMYAKLDTIGNFVIPPMRVVYPPHTQGGGMPRIAVDPSNKLHLVWMDQRLNPGVSTDIFYKRGENETGVQETEKLKSKVLPQISVFPNPFTTKTEI